MNFAKPIMKKVKIEKNNLQVHQLTHKSNIDIITSLIEELNSNTISSYKKTVILDYMDKLKSQADLIEAVFQVVESNITDNNTFLEVEIYE